VRPAPSGDYSPSLRSPWLAAFVQFLKEILKERTRSLVLLLDRASFHRSKKVRSFVRAHRSQIRIFFLPKYAPKLNPAEQVWNIIKNKGLRKMLITTKNQLKKKLRSQLRRLQIRKEKAATQSGDRKHFKSVCYRIPLKIFFRVFDTTSSLIVALQGSTLRSLCLKMIP